MSDSVQFARQKVQSETQRLKQNYHQIRKRTLEIVAPLTIEDYIPQPFYFASPPKWHIAHTTWFFEEMILKGFIDDYQPFHPDFSLLFNSYYNTVGERTLRSDRGSITRPGVQEGLAYRAHVDAKMERLFQKELAAEILTLVELGLNHEQQHQELLMTDLKINLSLNPIDPIYHSQKNLISQRNETPHEWIHISEGIYDIGHNGEGFYFDNERGQHRVFLEEYAISNQLITNKEYLEFIEDDGYKKHYLWLDEGWSWLNENDIQHPLYWRKEEQGWSTFTLAGRKPLDEDAILCHVSYYEAAAFAQWKGCRLPTEQEWEASSNRFDWGLRWEWTQSAYSPYPYFEIPEGAVGEYNGKFMVNQMVLRGASVVTAEGHSRKTYRNFFHPQFQWQFSGIRLAKHL